MITYIKQLWCKWRGHKSGYHLVYIYEQDPETKQLFSKPLVQRQCKYCGKSLSTIDLDNFLDNECEGRPKHRSLPITKRPSLNLDL